MVQISMMTTPGYFEVVTEKDLIVPRAIGMLTLMIGLFSLAAMIALSGWTKSKKMGRFTTIVGILTLLLIIVTLIRVE